MIARGSARYRGALPAPSFRTPCLYSQPGQYGASEVLVEFYPHVLVLCLQDGIRHTVALKHIRLTQPLETSVWHLDWKITRSDSGHLVLRDCAVQQQIRQQPPAGLKKALLQLQRAQRAARRIPRILAPFLVGLSLLLSGLAALYWVYPEESQAWISDQLSIRFETTIGHQLFSQSQQNFSRLNAPLALQALKDIGGKLSEHSVRHYRWYISDQEEPLLYVFPGGILVISRGLLVLTHSAEEAAGLLAHAVQHIEQRDSLKALFSNLGLKPLLMLFFAQQLPEPLLKRSLAALYEPFLPAVEQLADRNAWSTLEAAGIDPRGLISLPQRLRHRNLQQKLADRAPFRRLKEQLTQRLDTLDKFRKTRSTRHYIPLKYAWDRVRSDLQTHAIQALIRTSRD